MEITVLVDNIPHEDLEAEWGLAVYIEHDGHKLLLDTGASDLFIKNAEKLGIDLKEVEAGFLSHAHYDHSDGMDSFFEYNDHAKFYVRSGSEENCYDTKEEPRYVGIKPGIMEQYKERIELVSGDYEVMKDVYLIPHKTKDLKLIGEKMCMSVKKNDIYLPDDFSHEQSLVIRTDKGLVIFNSCCHGGASNIINEIQDTFKGEKVGAILGGFHLYRSSDDEVRALGNKISATGIGNVYTGHCSLELGYSLLKEVLGDQVQQMYCGMKISL